MGGRGSKKQQPELVEKERVKIVVIGDGAVGKTCLLIKFATGTFPADYVPTVFDNFSADCELGGGKKVEIGLWDTAGEDYDRLRPLSYRETDVFLICFSVLSPDSMERMKTKWVPEIMEHCSGIPCVLVGCKMDLAEDQETLEALEMNKIKPLTKEEGEMMAKELGAAGCVYCSSLTGENVPKVFNTAVRTALLRDPPAPHAGPQGLSVKRARK